MIVVRCCEGKRRFCANAFLTIVCLIVLSCDQSSRRRGQTDILGYSTIVHADAGGENSYTFGRRHLPYIRIQEERLTDWKVRWGSDPLPIEVDRQAGFTFVRVQSVPPTFLPAGRLVLEGPGQVVRSWAARWRTAPQWKSLRKTSGDRDTLRPLLDRAKTSTDAWTRAWANFELGGLFLSADESGVRPGVDDAIFVGGLRKVGERRGDAPGLFGRPLAPSKGRLASVTVAT